MASSASSTSWLALQSFVTMGLGLITTVLAARIYGPETMGYITFAVAYTTLFVPLARLGLDAILIHEILKQPERASQVLWTAVALRLFASTIVVGAIWLSIELVDSDAVNREWLAIIAFSAFGSIGESFLGALQSQHLIKFGAIIRIAVSLITATARIFVLLAELPIEFFVYTYVSDVVLMATGLFSAYYAKAAFAAPHKIDLCLAKTLLMRSWPLIASGMAVALYSRIDQVMIGYITGSTVDTAIYAASATLAEIWYFLPMALITVLQVNLLAGAQDPQLLTANTQRLYDLVAGTSIVICIAMTVLAWPAIGVLYGPQYTTTASIVSIIILSWAGLFAMMGSARGPWLIARNLQRYSLIYLSTGCAANICLNYFLIPALGISGAAVATFLSQVLTAAVLPLVFADTRFSVRQILRAFHPRNVWQAGRLAVKLLDQGRKGK